MAVAVLLWLLATAVGWGVAWLGKWGIRKERTQRAVGFIEVGVRETYLEYVREIKKAKDGDGKLTTDERKEATRRAIEYAKLYAVNEGADLLKLAAKSVLPLLVDKAVAKLKGTKAPLG